MKFVVRIRKKHLEQLLREAPGIAPQDLFETALAIGLNTLTAPARGKAPKA